jgi:hypothetical protein
VNRISRARAEVGPGQRVSAYEGLKAMTAWGAEQYDEQFSKGTLEVGKLADLVILDRDPLEVAPSEIKDIKVVETIKEGVTIYPAAAGAAMPVAKAADGAKTHTWKAHVCDMVDINQAAHKLWTLVALNGTPIAAGNPPTMKFEHGRVSVFGGINRLSGSYALVGDTVTFGPMMSTRMAGEPALMELEHTLAKALASVDGFRVAGDDLVLLSGGTAVAAFRAGE